MIVLDTSAVLHMISRTQEGSALEALMLMGEETCAPQLLATETCNALWKNRKAGLISSDDAMRLIPAALGLVDAFHPDESLLMEATHEAIRLNHPVYDMLYFVLARRTSSTLFTLNRKLQSLCLDNGVNCICPMDLPEAPEAGEGDE